MASLNPQTDNQSGFTVIEILLALQMGILVIGFSYLAFQFVSEYSTQWQKRLDREREVALVSTVITQHFDMLIQLNLATENHVKGLRQSGESDLVFHSAVALNGKPLLQKGSVVEHHELSYFFDSGVNGVPLLEISTVREDQLQKVRGIKLILQVEINMEISKIEICSRLPRLGELRRLTNAHHESASAF